MSTKLDSGEHKKIDIDFEPLVMFNVLVEAVNQEQKKPINKEKILLTINHD